MMEIAAFLGHVGSKTSCKNSSSFSFLFLWIFVRFVFFVQVS
jgi:hypothetical protein